MVDKAVVGIMKMARRLLILVMMLVVAVGCEHKEMCYRHPHTATVRVNVDWSDFVKKETPSGMTVLVYQYKSTVSKGSKPSGNDVLTEPVKVMSNNTDYVEVDLPEGIYHSIVFNQSETEFGTLMFKDLNEWEKAQVVAGPAPTKWYTTRGEDEKTAYEPEWLGTSWQEGAVLTYDMIQQWAEYYGVASKAPDAMDLIFHTAKNVIYTVNISVKVKNVYNLKYAREAIEGMAEGYHLSKAAPLNGKVTHLLEEWNLQTDPVDATTGYLKAKLLSFGLPLGHTSTPQENTLNLSVLLVDNKTQLDFYLPVGDLWQKSAQGEELQLSLNLEIPDPLPDVKPEGGSSGGFDATVEDWGDEIEIEIPI